MELLRTDQKCSKNLRKQSKEASVVVHVRVFVAQVKAANFLKKTNQKKPHT